MEIEKHTTREQRASDIYELFKQYSFAANTFRYNPGDTQKSTYLSVKSTLELLSVFADDYIENHIDEKLKPELQTLREKTNKVLKTPAVKDKNTIEEYKNDLIEINMLYSKLINVAIN